MQRKASIHVAVRLCSLFAIVDGFFQSQDGASLRTHFLSLLEQEMPSSFPATGETGLPHLPHQSWSLSTRSATIRRNDTHGVEHAVSKAKETSESAIPSGRKQMYFRPVSATLQCVMSLTIISLLVYTALSISRNSDELSATFSPSIPTQMLTIAARVSGFAPMLCMLFVACRMYILATTEGLGEPPSWVKTCMWTAVSGMALQLVVVLVLPALTKKQAEEDAAYDMTEGKQAQWSPRRLVHDDTQPPTEEQVTEDIEGGAKLAIADATGEQNDVHPNLNDVELRKDKSQLQVPFWLTQAFSMVLIYGGITGVIVGIFTFPAQSTKVSAAVLCTIYLSILYFSVSFILWFFRACADSSSPITNAALAMSTVARKAPMFSVLFLASRMRALQLDPPNGMPPFWMQCCFYGIVICIYLETIIACFIGCIGEKTKGYYGVYIFRTHRKCMTLLYHTCALASYALIFPVVKGVYEMEDQQTGEQAPLSTTLLCVLMLEAMYFFVTFAQTAIMFVEELEGVDYTVIRDATISAGISLNLAPLLCILFVSTRMRALQITQQKGDPQGWAQDCMFISVMAVGVQSICCLLMPIFIGAACKFDEDGNPDYDLEPMIGAYAVSIVKYVALLALHGSVMAVCIAVYIMTPDTAHKGGAFLDNRKALWESCLVVLLVFSIALLFSSAKVVGMAIKFAIESADQELIGVDIEIKKVALNLFKGYVHVQRMRVCQPPEEIVWTRDKDGKLHGEKTGITCEWVEDYIAKADLILIKINLWRLFTTMGREFEVQNLSIEGIHFNIEKPNTDMKAENANVQYIINHLDSLGLIPPKEDPKTPRSDDASPRSDASPRPAKEEPTKEQPKVEAPTKDDNAKKEEQSDKPSIHIGKIVLGDIGAGVCIRGVKIVGQIKFHPHLPVIHFDDVTEEVFHGKEDLEPKEMVALIIQKVAKKVFHRVVKDVPHELAQAVKGAAQHAVQDMKSSVSNAMKKVPCQ